MAFYPSIRFALADNPKLGVEIQTAHYDLYTEAPNPQETGVILERFYDKLKEFFGTEPKERLRVQQYVTENGYRRAAEATPEDWTGVPLGGYSLLTKTVFVRVLPASWATRHVLLHECVHQFQFLARTGNKTPASSIYAEGLPEYLAGTSWDGKTLQVGIDDSFNADFVSGAFDVIEHHHDRILRKAMCDVQIAGQDILNPENEKSLNYSEARAIVTFLATEHPERFHRLAAQLDAGEDTAKAWDQAFAGVGFSPDALDTQYSEWLSEHIQPLACVGGYWDRHDQAVEGISEEGGYGWAIAQPHRQEDYGVGDKTWIQVQEITAQIACKKPQTDAGLAVAIPREQSMGSFLVLLTVQNTIEVHKTQGTSYSSLIRTIQLDGKQRANQWKMSATYHDGQWHVCLDNHEVVAIPATENTFCGLAVKGDAEFATDLDTK